MSLKFQLRQVSWQIFCKFNLFQVIVILFLSLYVYVCDRGTSCMFMKKEGSTEPVCLLVACTLSSLE